jgi:hypothetical protein
LDQIVTRKLTDGDVQALESGEGVLGCRYNLREEVEKGEEEVDDSLSDEQ